MAALITLINLSSLKSLNASQRSPKTTTVFRSHNLAYYPCVFVDVILKIILLCDDIFCDDVIEMNTDSWRERAIFMFSEPRNLRRFFEVLNMRECNRSTKTLIS